MLKEFEGETFHYTQDHLGLDASKSECLHGTPQALLKVAVSKILLIQEMVIDLLVPFLFATNDLSDMLHSQLP